MSRGKHKKTSSCGSYAAMLVDDEITSLPHYERSSLTGKRLLYFTSVFVSLGVFLFGYDQGVMSGIITGPHFKRYFHNPSAASIGNMVAILEIGALISSLLVGKVGETLGRRRTIRYGALIFVVGGVIQTFASKMSHLVLGRVVSGLGVGMLSTIVPIYQSEISPPHNRGQLACIEFTGNIIGYASSVWVDYFCSFMEGNASWRVPLSIQCVIGLMLFAGSHAIVETPRWLLNHDQDEEGMVVIADLYADGDIESSITTREFCQIKETVLNARLDGEHTYYHMFTQKSTRVLIAMSSQFFAQLNGINIVSYYGPMVFEEAGWVGRQAILMAGINSIVYVMSTVPPWYLVDKWGRKPLLLSGGAFMALSLTLIALSLWHGTVYTPSIVVLCVIFYNACFGYSWGPVPWLIPSEISPLSIRSKMASLATATNWAANWLVGIMTPILQERIGWKMYLIPTVSCVISCWVVYKFYPETAGLKLEDMDSVFDDYSVSSRSTSLATAASTGLSERNSSFTPLLNQVEPPTLHDIFVYKSASTSRFTKLYNLLTTQE